MDRTSVYNFVHSEQWQFVKDKLAEQMITVFSRPYTGTMEEKGLQLTARQETQQIITDVINTIEQEAEQIALENRLEKDKPSTPLIHTIN